MTDNERRQTTRKVASEPGAATREFARRHADMAESMQRLLRFQRQTLALKRTKTVEETLDAMESLLVEVVDFTFCALQARDAGGNFASLREIRPESLALDYPLMNWVMETQEVSILPVDVDVCGAVLRSLLFLPFGECHIMLLWLEQAADAFTREQEALLSMLARETGAVLGAHESRNRLEKTRAGMSDIIESIPLGLLALDPLGRVQMINSTAEIALDVRRQNVVGKGYGEAMPSAMAQLLGRMLRESSSDEEELVLASPGGEDQYLGVTVSPARGEYESDRSGRVVVCRDLRLSREVQKLRQLDSMKNDFLSLVSHELRTPLTSILATAETLIMDANENIPAEWREYLDIIHSEGKRLSRLIDDVLDLTRMEAGKMHYDFAQHDPNETIGGVVMAMMPLAEAKNHTLELEFAEDIGECRLALDRFTQVVTNIISNAIKYTEPGGRIVIRTKRTPPFENSVVPTFLMEVEDNGIGIAPENLDKVFSKFEMVEEVTNHTVGTGLGMAICKQIIEEGHSGRIWLKSEPGAGTTVYVRLPIR